MKVDCNLARGKNHHETISVSLSGKNAKDSVCFLFLPKPAVANDVMAGLEIFKEGYGSLCGFGGLRAGWHEWFRV